MHKTVTTTMHSDERVSDSVSDYVAVIGILKIIKKKKTVNVRKMCNRKIPYKFNLSRFCEIMDMTEEEIYKNFYWAKDVVKINPTIWFYPEERNSDDVTTINKEDLFILPYNLMYSKKWCDQVESVEVTSEKKIEDTKTK